MMEARKPDWAGLIRLVVVTPAGGPARGPVQVAAAALAAGCRAVQLRDKEASDREFAGLARAVMRSCGEKGALFFVNDRVDVASAVGADGVHLGAMDLRVEDARGVLGAAPIIGYSPEGLEDARAALQAGADYLGVGPVFGTPTKADAGEPIGPDGLSLYVADGAAPVLAVGGIDEGNALEAFRVGAAGVAVVSAVAGAADMEEATRRLLERIGKV